MIRLMSVASGVVVLLVSSPAFASLTMHEWGTFTAVQGSNGIPLEALEHEDDPLPDFVHGRGEVATPEPAPSPHTQPRSPHPPRGCRTFKCADFDTAPGTPFAVTQKMETPVLYFYSDREQDVEVDVRYPRGIISQYYPAPSLFEPPLNGASALEGGRTVFDVRVLGRSFNSMVPSVPPSSIYAPARQVDSNPIRSSAGEYEKFIFYRGLGRFETELRVTSGPEDRMTVSNEGRNPIQSVLLMRIANDGRGAIFNLGGLAGRSSQDISKVRNLVDAKLKSRQEFLSDAKTILVSELTRSGLYLDESVAMANTWEKSYFGQEGLRVLYILNRGETEALLPMRVSPQPDSLVRTLVGRVEVLTAQEEDALLHQIEAAPESDLSLLGRLGRFAEAKLLRLKQISPNGTVIQRIEKLLAVVRSQG